MYAFFFFVGFFFVCFFCVCVNTDIDVGLKKTKNGEKKKSSRDLLWFYNIEKNKHIEKNRK